MKDPIEEERLKRELLNSAKIYFEKRDYLSAIRCYDFFIDKYYFFPSLEDKKVKINLRKIANHYLENCKFPDDEVLITLGDLLLGDDWNSIRNDSELAFALFSECKRESLSRNYELWLTYFEATVRGEGA